MTAASSTLLSLTALFALACSHGNQDQIGASEPFRVRAPDKSPAAQFFKGKLPGTPPPSKPLTMGMPPRRPDAGMATDAGTRLPDVIEHSGPNVVLQGRGNVPFKGTTSDTGYSVGLALEGVGTGYWVVPVEAVDIMGDPQWDVLCDFDPSVPTGSRRLLSVAFDGQGRAGQQQQNTICIVPTDVIGYFTPCDHSAPPEAVISLTWDTEVDLDLQVLTPEGRLVTSKSPTVLPPNDAGIIPTGGAQIDRDSNAGCLIDGARTENLVWPKGGGQPQGRYGIYVNLYDSCKQPAVHFTVTVFAARNNSDGGGRHLTKFFEQSGELLDFQANGGTGRGLFVSEFIFR